MKIDELKEFIKVQFEKAETPEAIEAGVKANALISDVEAEQNKTQEALKSVKEAYTKLLNGSSSTEKTNEPSAKPPTFEELLAKNAVKEKEAK